MVINKTTDLSGKYYVYSHLRLDTNEIFYIGIGAKYRSSTDYSRSKQKGKYRSRFWNNVTFKTKYSISVIFESDDYNQVKNKEKELIKFYGKKIDNKGGSLVNLTDGGDGMLGFRDQNAVKSVCLYTKDGVFFKQFDAHIDCANFLGVKRVSLSLSINKNHLVKDYIVKDHKSEKVNPIKNIKEKLSDRLSKKVIQMSRDSEEIKCWKSTEEASRELKISGGHIREVCAGKRKSAGNYLWKYF
jgi:hypothetical protein